MGISVVTKERKFTYVNRALLDIYGYGSMKELKAVPLKQRYTPQSYAEHQARKERVRRGEAVPASYELDRLASFPRLNPNPIVEMDLNGEVTYLNPAAYGEFADLLTKKPMHPILKALRSIISYLPHLEERFLSLDTLVGDRIYEQYVSYNPENNRLRSYIQNITEQRRAATLEAEAAAARLASQAKSAFLAGMSHELRTPLNAIIGFSEILKESYFGKLNKKQEEYVKDILESGHHLLALINDILDLSKIEAGKTGLELTPVDIEDLLQDSLIMIKEKALKHRIGLNVNIAPELKGAKVMADKRKLRQVIFNLLSNAAKFTPDGGAITITARPQKNGLTIEVADTGIGIAPEHQGKVFEEFYQIKGGITDKTPGTGLGLSLTKSLVEMHNGRIWLESEGNGKGSRFIFTLPFKVRKGV